MVICIPGYGRAMRPRWIFFKMLFYHGADPGCSISRSWRLGVQPPEQLAIAPIRFAEVRNSATLELAAGPSVYAS